MKTPKEGTPKKGLVIAIGVAVACLLASPALAQWVNVPQAGTPRTPDGKPDLTAPAPRAPDGKPDLSGIWQRPRGSQPGTGGADGTGGTDDGGAPGGSGGPAGAGASGGPSDRSDR